EDGSSSNLEHSAVSDIHLIVKWSARFGADTVAKHMQVVEQHGAVWWGLYSVADSDWRVAEQWTNQLRTQIADHRDAFVFVVGPTCWQTRLLDVQYDRAAIEPELVPGYYGSE